MKTSILSLVLLLSTISTHSAWAARVPMIVGTSADEHSHDIFIAHRNTDLPYNLLLSDKVCFVGEVDDVREIIQKMIANHMHGARIQIERIESSFLDRQDGFLAVTLNNGHSFRLYRCVLKRRQVE